MLPIATATGGLQLASNYARLRQVHRLIDRKQHLSVRVPLALLAERDQLQRQIRVDRGLPVAT